MVPVEVTAFGLLAVCVILLACVLFVNLVFPRDAAVFARYVFVPTLVVVVALAIYVLVVTRTH